MVSHAILVHIRITPAFKYINSATYGPVRSTIEVIHVIWRLVEKYKRQKRSSNGFDEAKTRDRMVVDDSKHFPIEMGIHQGSILSPFILVLVMDELTWSIQEEEVWRQTLESKEFSVELDKTDVKVRFATQTIPKRENLRIESVIQNSRGIDDDVKHSIGVVGVMDSQKLTRSKDTCCKDEDVEKDMLSGEKVRVTFVANKMREVRLRWFEHMHRRCADAPMKRCEKLVVKGT
ncbi:hypothetical protein H5410_055564 [Solanum commersonii]|uniref:Reverse transcriptase domain-containing protein n=1 Tax=Solanum commersonii TaxID=4109 RepID=A0A9J5WKM7_SOLCO|nr:hypothetical protein H5410_055564 [Solanum commersonii]